MGLEREIYAASHRFAHSDDQRAWLELFASVALYICAMVIGLASIGTWWLTAIAIVLAAAMGLRIYMIQHDCLHRSFFKSKKLNDSIGSLLSPIAMTPYKATRYIHGLHHTYVSDLERRDAFEIFTMTLNEWKSASKWKRIQYRYYRSPVVLILIGPFLLYSIFRRFPLKALKTGLGDLIFHNVLLASYLGLVWWAAGWAGIGFWIATVYLACAFGSLIPYIVHNFESIHWGRRP